MGIPSARRNKHGKNLFLIDHDYRRPKLSEFSLGEIKSATIGRRAVLCGAAAFLFNSLASDTSQAAVAATGVKQVGKKLQVTLSKNKGLAKVGGAVTIKLSDGSQIALIRTSSAMSGFKALNLSCTHQGVTVEENGSGWICPAHGSQFDLVGKVERGPASANLYSYPTKATKTTVTIG